MPRISVIQGDITRQDTDAIVNAANPVMVGGGGVDGAIHRAAGRKLLEACRAVPTGPGGIRCPTGQARITPGFDLSARYVVHTVGPIYGRDPDPERSLRSSISRSLALAAENGCRSVAVPAISCGSYGYPVERAAEILLDEASKAEGLEEVRFVLYGEDTHAVFAAVFGRKK